MTASAPPSRHVGRRVHLRPLGPEHLADLLHLASGEQQRQGWPLWGYILSPHDLGVLLSAGDTPQFAVEDRSTGRLIGFVRATDVDHRSKTAAVDVLIDDRLWAKGWPIEGVLLLLRYLFHDLLLRKVYFHVPAYVLPRLHSAVDVWLQVEARLTEHLFAAGHYHDLYVLSLTNDVWRSISPIVGRPPAPGTSDVA